MRLSLDRLYPLLALLLLAGGTVWLERVTRADDPRPNGPARRDPDFIAEDTRLVSFDADGRQRYVLLAERVTSYPFSRITQLENPRLRYDQDGRELLIEAERGQVAQDGEEVYLTGDVRVVRAPAPNSPAMTFTSASLRIWPEVERAETHDSVVLTQGANTARAQGLRTDHLFGTIDLLGDVHIHMPRSRTPR